MQRTVAYGCVDFCKNVGGCGLCSLGTSCMWYALFPCDQYAAIHDAARTAEADAVEAALKQRYGRRRSTEVPGEGAPGTEITF
jgi:hypothetical protein